MLGSFSPLPLSRALAVLLSSLMVALPAASQSNAAPGAGPSGPSASRPKTASQAKTAKKKPAKHKPAHRMSRAARVARTARIKKAFVASKELQPMAQQLATMRTPQAYAGVAAYARSHTGEAAAAAYLALGHAYLLDKRYAEAESALAQARHDDGELADYADFLAAQASHEAGDDPAAESHPARLCRSLSGEHLRRPGARARGQRPAGDEQAHRRAPGAGRSREH